VHIVRSAAPEDAISSWNKMFADFQTSPLEFYAAVAQAVGQRQIPDTTISRVEHKEGGVASSGREYLRVRRGTFAFDICAAPFGKDFFFSSWLAEPPMLSGLYKLLIMFGLLIVFAVFEAYSFFLGPFEFLLVLLIALFVISQGESPVSTAVGELPGIGWLYRAFFKPPTYYRHDTGSMFLSAVHGVVLEVIDGLTTAKGVRALTELERKPVMREFFRK
jgi:hypothetical protein